MADDGRIRRSLIMGGLSAVGFGVWSYLVNRSHGTGAGLRAAATQAFISFTVTFVMTLIMEHTVELGRGRLTRFALPLCASVCFSVSYNLGLHTATGTPELLKTIAPGVTGGALYSIAYAARLSVQSAPAAP